MLVGSVNRSPRGFQPWMRLLPKRSFLGGSSREAMADAHMTRTGLGNIAPFDLELVTGLRHHGYLPFWASTDSSLRWPRHLQLISWMLRSGSLAKLCLPGFPFCSTGIATRR